MHSSRRLAVGALTLAAATSVAWAQTAPPPGRVYVFHSSAQGECPALDWHIVVGQNGSLEGMIAWNSMQQMARATGTVNAGKVQMTAKEVGGQGRTATVDGTVQSDGWFTVNVSGPGVKCQSIKIPFYAPTPGGGSG